MLRPANPALPAMQHHGCPRASVPSRPAALPLSLSRPSNEATQRKTMTQEYCTAHPQNAAGLTMGQPRVLMMTAAPALPDRRWQRWLRSLWWPTVKQHSHDLHTGLHGSSTDPRQTTAPSLGQFACDTTGGNNGGQKSPTASLKTRAGQTVSHPINPITLTHQRHIDR